MKKNIITLLILLIFSSHSYADKCYNNDTTPVIIDSDKKPGRFFEDQPDAVSYTHLTLPTKA